MCAKNLRVNPLYPLTPTPSRGLHPRGLDCLFFFQPLCWYKDDDCIFENVDPFHIRIQIYFCATKRDNFWHLLCRLLKWFCTRQFAHAVLRVSLRFLSNHRLQLWWFASESSRSPDLPNVSPTTFLAQFLRLRVLLTYNCKFWCRKKNPPLLFSPSPSLSRLCHVYFLDEEVSTASIRQR